MDHRRVTKFLSSVGALEIIALAIAIATFTLVEDKDRRTLIIGAAMGIIVIARRFFQSKE